MVKTSVTVDAPIEQVWAALADESKLSSWCAFCPRLSYPEGTRRADPTGQEFILSLPTARQAREQRCEYVSYLPPRQLSARAFDEAGAVISTYTLRSDGRRTVLSFALEPENYRLAWRLVTYLMTPLIYWINRSALKRLRRVVEDARQQPV